MNITNLWQGAWTAGSVHTVKDQSWNSSLPAGGTAFFGWCGTRTVPVAVPFDCTLNGAPCGGAGGPPPPPPATRSLRRWCSA